MFDNLIGLGAGIIGFGVLLGVGSVVLFNLAGSTAQCPADMTGGAWNATSGTCTNSTDSASAGGTAYTNTNYVLGQLGQSGLAGWTPAIIALSIGMLFLGGFLINKSGKKRRY